MKPRITIFVAYYLPGTRAGGPIRSISNLVSAIGDRFDFSILTLDHDFGRNERYPGIEPFTWIVRDEARVQYLSSGWRGLKTIVAAAIDPDADAVYLNSLFERRFSMLPLWTRVVARRRLENVILAPRGELSEAAQRSKPKRKAIYLAALKAFGIPRRVTWMASSEFERRDIQGTFGGVLVRMAPPLPHAPSGGLPSNLVPKEPGTLKLIFVGRVLPHKGLHVVLDLLARVKGTIRLEIAGPIEDDNYWAKCQDQVAALPKDVSVTYLGVLGRSELEAALKRAELFVLPTRSENFGHAIAEALAAGLPVLISDATPWRGLADEGVGWDVSLEDVEAFADALGTMIDMGAERHTEMRHRALAYVSQVARAPELVNANAALFREAAAS